MALRITDECLNCGAYEPECPSTAIYEGSIAWRWRDGTKLNGQIVRPDGFFTTAEAAQSPLATEHYYVVPGKCNECIGFHEEPQCAAVCPVDCIVQDPDHAETAAALVARAQWLHQHDDPFTSYQADLQARSPKEPGSNCGCGGHSCGA